MITEDYISFEVAKLLKEKGFDEDCTKVYINGELRDVITKESIKECTHCFNHYLYAGDAAAPTLQMAMKWLREVHKLYIEFVLNQDVLNEEAVIENYYFFNVSRLDRFANEGGDCKSYKSYEEACEAAIKYCLINLI